MQNAQDKQELIALMDYLVKHNISHTEELSALASQVESVEGKEMIIQAIEEYKVANATLKNALEKLR